MDERRDVDLFMHVFIQCDSNLLASSALLDLICRALSALLRVDVVVTTLRLLVSQHALQHVTQLRSSQIVHGGVRRATIHTSHACYDVVLAARRDGSVGGRLSS